MTLPSGMVEARYRDTRVAQCTGNPFIEALPPMLERKQLREAFGGTINMRPSDVYLEEHTRIHVISQLLDQFFQPLARHIELESKLSIMLRQGYVGRNLANGNHAAHIQNMYPIQPQLTNV